MTATKEKISRFQRLNAIDCSKHIEKKGKFNYLSWSWAWAMFKIECPDATFEKHHYPNSDGHSVPYTKDEEGYAYVNVSVTTEGEKLSEVFPVLNNSNRPIQNPNSFDVNTALQRCLVKAIAFHGLGLHIYAGEDLPEQVSAAKEEAAAEKKKESEAKALTERTSRALAFFGGMIENMNAETDHENLMVWWDRNQTALKKRLSFFKAHKELSAKWQEVQELFVVTEQRLKEQNTKEKKDA